MLRLLLDISEGEEMLALAVKVQKDTKATKKRRKRVDDARTPRHARIHPSQGLGCAKGARPMARGRTPRRVAPNASGRRRVLHGEKEVVAS
jgi:hypothetical protein